MKHIFILNQIEEYNILEEFHLNLIDINNIIQLINNSEKLEFDVLYIIYTNIQNILYINLQYITKELLDDIINGIINRILYEMIYSDINYNTLKICDKIIKLYYTKKNPDIYDNRLKCFMEQLYNHYIVFNINYSDMNKKTEYNILSIINICNININQSLHYNNYINLPLQIQCDIINLYNHFLNQYDIFCDKMNIIEFANYIGSYFYYTNGISNLTLFILTNTNCKFLFDKINKYLSNIIFNKKKEDIEILTNFINLCNTNEICNSDAFIFYIYYIKIIIESYLSNNLYVIINNYNKFYNKNKFEKYYFHYLTQKEINCGIFYIEYILIQLFKNNSIDNINIFHKDIIDIQYLPKYITKYINKISIS